MNNKTKMNVLTTPGSINGSAIDITLDDSIISRLIGSSRPDFDVYDLIQVLADYIISETLSIINNNHRLIEINSVVSLLDPIVVTSYISLAKERHEVQICAKLLTKNISARLIQYGIPISTMTEIYDMICRTLIMYTEV